MPRRPTSAASALAFDLKAERKKFKISQVEAAKILMVTQPTVARWEKSGGMPHVYRVVWNIWKHSQESQNGDMRASATGTGLQTMHREFKEQTNEGKEYGDVESKTGSAGRNRRANVIELRTRQALGRQQAHGNISTSGSTSNRERVTRRKGSNSSDSKDNELRIKEISDGIKQSTDAIE